MMASPMRKTSRDRCATCSDRWSVSHRERSRFHCATKESPRSSVPENVGSLAASWYRATPCSMTKEKVFPPPPKLRFITPDCRADDPRKSTLNPPAWRSTFHSSTPSSRVSLPALSQPLPPPPPPLLGMASQSPSRQRLLGPQSLLFLHWSASHLPLRHRLLPPQSLLFLHLAAATGSTSATTSGDAATIEPRMFVRMRRRDLCTARPSSCASRPSSRANASIQLFILYHQSNVSRT